MKKILLIAVLLGAMLSVTVYFVCIAAPSVFFGKGLKGSGNIVTRTIEAPAFDRIDAARAVKVVITDKTSGKIIIAADDNVMDYVVVEANGGRLTATIDKSINNLSNADVTVTVPANGSIRALDASSAAKISGDVVLNADKFAMDASSAAKIDVSVKAQSCAVAASSASKINASVEAVSCSVEASSASKITLKGSAAKCTADLSSASKLSAGDFVAAECSVNTSSAAKAVVNCTERLHADASSGSSIRYSGDCRTSINKSSGGTFIQPSQELREKGVRMKLSAVRSIVRGKRVVLVDDSIVRGTTSRRIVTMLKEAGATEVHVRIASPPMTDPCFYGVDTSTREELISARKNTAGVCEEIGADSLVFLSPESLLKAGSRKELCMACFTGQYPTALYQSPEEANKDVKC